MQFQVECNSLRSSRTMCLGCQKQFQPREARVIVCDEQGKSYGELCPQCIAKGMYWLGNRLQQLH